MDICFVYICDCALSIRFLHPLWDKDRLWKWLPKICGFDGCINNPSKHQLIANWIVKVFFSFFMFIVLVLFRVDVWGLFSIFVCQPRTSTFIILFVCRQLIRNAFVAFIILPAICFIFFHSSLEMLIWCIDWLKPFDANQSFFKRWSVFCVFCFEKPVLFLFRPSRYMHNSHTHKHTKSTLFVIRMQNGFVELLNLYEWIELLRFTLMEIVEIVGITSKVVYNNVYECGNKSKY